MRVRTDLWNQFGANPGGSGFRLVNSTPANALRWISDFQDDIGPQSPVISADGTIYAGTQHGRLVAIEPLHGQVKWNITIGGPALAVLTPAVADDGTVYCLCAPNGTIRDHRTSGERGVQSFVVAVNTDGTVRWRVPIRPLADRVGTIHGEILGAPRIVSGPQGEVRIVFVLRYTPLLFYPEVAANVEAYVRVLAIVDQRGTFLLFNQYEENRIFIEITGGGGGFGGATLEDPPPRGIPKHAKPRLDTPVVFGALPAREPWTIVAPGEQGLYIVRWSDNGGALARSTELLKFSTPFPAPVAFPNGLLAFGGNSSATILETDTFTQYVTNPIFVTGQSTYAGGLRQMYFVTRYGSLELVDSNGEVRKRRDLGGGSVAFPALSANHVHVASTEGMHTFTLDLEEVATITNHDAGFSSPVIGPGGEVYLAVGRTLYSYFDVNARVQDIRDHRPGRNVLQPARTI